MGPHPLEVRMRFDRPVTEAELTRAVRLLEERGVWGISREEFAHLFGSDRRGRQVMAELRKRGRAAVIVASGPQGKEVYRLPENEAEYRAFKAQLLSRIKELEAALAGMERAWQAGGKRVTQEQLF